MPKKISVLGQRMATLNTSPYSDNISLLLKLAVLPTLLFAADDDAHFLYSTVNQFFKENQNYRLDHAVFVDNREEYSTRRWKTPI